MWEPFLAASKTAQTGSQSSRALLVDLAGIAADRRFEVRSGVILRVWKRLWRAQQGHSEHSFPPRRR
jgi:hypothetical protein